MELKEIRTMCVQRSGRYDLVKSNYSDNGADSLINEGIRQLELRASHSDEFDWFSSNFSDPLEDDDDSNFWTENYPYLVFKAFMYALSISMEVASVTMYWSELIDLDLSNITNAAIQSEDNDDDIPLQMQSSWNEDNYGT